MPHVPSKFLARMEKLLPRDQYAAFCAALDAPAVRALRINTVKAEADRVLPLLPFAATPLPFAENAFYATDDKVGALPCHHAGMIYMQDPSAISAVAALEVKKGLRVLDLCAAPGGKSTQLAAAIGEAGVLVSNEYVPARCRILQGNVERMGLANTVVTNLSADALADFYGDLFDLVVVDAPCSGEGMLRKYEVASEVWSEENVRLCAARQREILESAVRCVAPGGKLLYSTCTFSPEENEQNVAWLLDTYPEFALIPVRAEVAAVTADGISVNGRDLSLCRRFYPHLSPGEGQFLALLARRTDAEAAPKKPHPLQTLGKNDAAAVQKFLQDTLLVPPAGDLVLLRDTVYLAPRFPIPAKGVFAAGVAVGELVKGRVVPHHHFFSAFGKRFCRKLDLCATDPRTQKYLRGEELDCPELADLSNGYACVFFEGAPLGGGKTVDARLKNHYPKGLRNKS